MPQPFEYSLSNVPQGCTSFYNGQVVIKYFDPDTEPVPASMILNYPGQCTGITATLIED